MVLKRHLADLDPAPRWARALAVAALVLTPAAVAPADEVPPGPALVSLLVLGLFCTAAAFVFYGALVAEAGSGPRAGHHLHRAGRRGGVGRGGARREQPGAGAVAGLLLILAGSWLSTDGRLPPGLAALVERRRARRGKPRASAAVCDELRM